MIRIARLEKITLLKNENEMAGHKDESAAEKDVIFGSIQCNLSGSCSMRDKGVSSSCVKGMVDKSHHCQLQRSAFEQRRERSVFDQEEKRICSCNTPHCELNKCTRGQKLACDKSDKAPFEGELYVQGSNGTKGQNVPYNESHQRSVLLGSDISTSRDQGDMHKRTK